MADKRISQLIERTDIANNDVLPIVASGATTTNKVTISTIQDWMQSNLDVGVTSVGLTMPSAFQVSGSPITTSGNITVTATGTASQYIRGDGTLADFPQGGGGGGASVSYYLNGSVSQGTIGGVAYLEMNKVPVIGTGTNFTINANGYIASFITDAGDPGLLEIPGGNWNFETYFQASSGGGTPSFYIELYKVNSGGTATLIASNSANPEFIAFGTTTTAYFSSLAVPTTTLAITDRLALRYYVTHSGRTITLHTENSNLCQIITTFTTGLTALNGLTAQVQNFATGTSGTNFNITSSGNIHTFNLPTASATNRGALSSADWITFNAKQDAGNYVTTDTTQTITGEKTFSGSSLRLAANGTADAVVLRNVSGTTGSDTGATTIGFNGSDNLFINTQSRGGFILSFNNSVSNRTYTLQDASGTLAFTSDLGNYIQGSGTADSIPKFTGTRTLANSAIRDTTSTVIISKNVSVDNGASQAINLTPANGGTTNRIETTGTLPLAIITSGASITLAAGGVTPQITLTSTGNVGIGTASPSNPVSFQRVLNVSGSDSALVLSNTTGTAKNWTIGALDSGNLTFWDSTSERMRITSSGAVGIGVSSPNTQFHVAGSATINDVVYLQRASSSLFLPVINYWNGSGQPLNGTKGDIVAIGNAGGDGVVFANANSEVLRITSGNALQLSGNSTTFSIGSISGRNRIQWDSTEFAFFNTANGYTAIGASAFNTRSDYRLKENVAPVQDALSKITSLKPCTFNFIAEPEKEVVGFIAHEVQEVFPQAISGEKDGFRIEQVEVSPAELDEEGNIITEAVIEEKEVPVYQGIDHSKLVPLLVASIQELKAEIESLKSQING